MGRKAHVDVDAVVPLTQDKLLRLRMQVDVHAPGAAIRLLKLDI